MLQPQEVKRSSEKTSCEQNKMIQARAYELYSQRGGGDGHDAEDWLRAEKEIHHNQAHRKFA